MSPRQVQYVREPDPKPATTVEPGLRVWLALFIAHAGGDGGGDDRESKKPRGVSQTELLATLQTELSQLRDRVASLGQ
jgi:hypothetical protein